MRKILLRSNRRIGAAGLLVAIALSGLAACLLLIPNMVSKFASVVVVVLACVVFALWYRYASGPRLEITEDELWVYVVGRSKPFRIPIDAVEVFFIGQGAVAGTEPGQPHGYRGAVAANVIIRLAESAVDWHHRDVNLQLGVWEDGYITIRGLWCEDINQELLGTLNRTLMEVKRKRREAQLTEVPK